jgi:hypothetical protein
MLMCSLVLSYGLPIAAMGPFLVMGQPIPRAMTYSAESAQIIRLEYGQTVAVKKLSKIEKTAITLSKLVNQALQHRNSHE